MTESVLQHAQQQAARWIILQQQADFTVEQQQALEHWLAQSELHQQAYRQARHTWKQAGRLVKNPVLAATDRSIQTVKPRGYLLKIMSVAAVLLLTIGIGWQQNIVMRLKADEFTAEQTQHVQLADGSRVILDARSAIRVEYSEQQRRVNLLQGAATFYVEPSSAPFHVRTKNTKIQALGTVFMVRQTAQQTDVAVLENAVAVKSSVIGQQFQLNQGQSLRIKPNANQEPIIQPITSDQQDWQQGYLIFNQQPLAEVVARVEVYCPYKLWLLNSEKAKQKVSAVLYLDRLDQGINELAESFELKQYDFLSVKALR